MKLLLMFERWLDFINSYQISQSPLFSYPSIFNRSKNYSLFGAIFRTNLTICIISIVQKWQNLDSYRCRFKITKHKNHFEKPSPPPHFRTRIVGTTCPIECRSLQFAAINRALIDEIRTLLEGRFSPNSVHAQQPIEHQRSLNAFDASHLFLLLIAGNENRMLQNGAARIISLNESSRDIRIISSNSPAPVSRTGNGKRETNVSICGNMFIIPFARNLTYPSLVEQRLISILFQKHISNIQYNIIVGFKF